MSYCKDCKHYKTDRVDGPQCTKGKLKATSPLAVKDCFDEAPGAGDEEVPSILAAIPEAPAKRGGGRKKEHENYTDENGVLMKWCRCCKQYKPASEFYKKTGPKDGLAYECKQCKTKLQVDGRARKRAEEADRIRQEVKEPDPVVEEPEEIEIEVDLKAPILVPDFDAELDKALYGETLIRDGDGAFLNFSGVYIPIVDWKSGSYGIKPSGLRRIAKYFFNLGTEAAK